jgi:hypothetical protein
MKEPMLGSMGIKLRAKLVDERRGQSGSRNNVCGQKMAVYS